MLKSSPSNAKKEFSNKLFDINDVFTSDEIRNQKLKLRGRFVDSSMQLFFDKNSKDEITFPNCNCEGSNRPSVMSMWGSCFAVFNAINDDIETIPYESEDIVENSDEATDIIELHIEQAKDVESYDYKQAEAHYNYAIDLCKQFGLKDERPYIKLGDLHMEHGKIDYALGCYNGAIDVICSRLYDTYSSVDTDVLSVINNGEKEYSKLQRQFASENRRYKASFLRQIFTSEPTNRATKNEYLVHCHEDYKHALKKLRKTFDKVKKICYKRNEDYSAKVCAQVIREIERCTSRGSEVIERRASGVQGLGDIFDEIDPNY